MHSLYTKLLKTIVALLLVALGSQCYALQITQVSRDPIIFNPQKSEFMILRFRLSESATVTINMFDGRDLLVRRLIREQPLADGAHEVKWDGRDESGDLVPPEAYHYTIKAVDEQGQQVEYDLTDISGGDSFDPEGVHWDSKTKQIQYILRKPARVNIRIGLENDGPMLRTMLNWVPRTSGVQSEIWDGMDQSGVLDLSQHPKRYIKVLAYELSQNTVIVGPRSNDVKLIKELPWGKIRRQPKKSKTKHMYNHSQQPIETRRDVKVDLQLSKQLPHAIQGEPVLTGIASVQLNVAAADREMLVNRRYETSFYIDGQLVWENEVGFLPMTWLFDTKNTNEGVHYVTANLYGYEGNFGIATLKVYVKH